MIPGEISSKKNPLQIFQNTGEGSEIIIEGFLKYFQKAFSLEDSLKKFLAKNVEKSLEKIV